MPILKYKTFEDAEKAQWNFRPDSDYFTMVFSLNSIMFKQMIIKKFHPGVYKYKTLQDAQKEMWSWLLEKR